MTRPTVLLVDDSLTVRMDIAHALEEAGFEVDAHGTLADARRSCAARRFDLAILDVVLPDGDGIELLVELRAAVTSARTPVILLSSEAEVRDRLAGLERGADDYFAKPYDVHKLIGRVNDLLASRAPASARPLVLVIDDSLTFCQAIRDGLTARGFSVAVSATAEEGLRIAAEILPDAVVVDGVLPGMDGASFVRRMRLEPRLSRVSCLFLTASETGADEVTALDAGADAFVRKEQGVETVVARLAAMMRASQSSRALEAGMLERGPKRVLLLTRSVAIHQWVQPVLTEDGADVVRARTEAEALRLLGVQRIDCVLVEEQDGSEDVEALCRRVRSAALLDRLPIVILSTARQPRATELLDAGADDWLPAEAATPELLRARIAALLRRRDIEERDRRIHAALADRANELERANEELRIYRELVWRMPLGALILELHDPRDPGSFRIQMANPATLSANGLGAEDMVGHTLVERFPDAVETEVVEAYLAAIDTGRPQRVAGYRTSGAGGERRWDVLAIPLGGRKVGVLCEDVTERLRLEERVHRSQRLEAIGALAGGIAHDFNNVLTVIQAHATFLHDELADGEPAREDTDAILDSTRRAARLTSQLLAFGRRQVQRLEVLSANSIVTDLDRMLRRLIGEDLKLVLALEPQLAHVRADPTQLEQTLMNLVINARDAMPHGGTITVATSNAALDETRVEALGSPLAPGPYVRIAVIDTGLGMDEATRARIFEPFFTTKGPGMGTGLGLATVYGIVRQSGGAIAVTSEAGRGSAFEVFLPAVDEETTGERPHPSPPRPERPPGTTVLLVEDDPLVQRAASRILETGGYEVLVAADGPSALSLAAAHQGAIDLLLTDCVMPGMSGPDLVAELVAARPAIRVIFMSGYPSSTLADRGALRPDVVWLPKPFTRDGLLAAVRTALGRY